MRDCVAILMAVYNGQKYLEQQIKSIIGQTYSDWHLFIRDDGSSDGTLAIANYYSSVDQRITLINDPALSGGGSKENFAAIYQYVKVNFDFKYYMFSDQDDVWKSTKIEKTLSACKATEKDYAGPVLVHSDLEVVDAELRTLGASFMTYRALDAERKDISHLLVQNNVTGCTALWNKELNDIVDLSDPSIAMHDWWMALVTSAFGNIVYVDEPLIKYRQHGDNVVGATNVNTIRFIIKRLMGLNHVKDTFGLSFKQANLLIEKYASKLTEEQLDILNLYCAVPKMNKIKRISTLIRNDFLKQGCVQIIGELLFI